MVTQVLNFNKLFTLIVDYRCQATVSSCIYFFFSQYETSHWIAHPLFTSVGWIPATARVGQLLYLLICSMALIVLASNYSSGGGLSARLSFVSLFYFPSTLKKNLRLVTRWFS